MLHTVWFEHSVSSEENFSFFQSVVRNGVVPSYLKGIQPTQNEKGVEEATIWIVVKDNLPPRSQHLEDRELCAVRDLQKILEKEKKSGFDLS